MAPGDAKYDWKQSQVRKGKLSRYLFLFTVVLTVRLCFFVSDLVREVRVYQRHEVRKIKSDPNKMDSEYTKCDFAYRCLSSDNTEACSFRL